MKCMKYSDEVLCTGNFSPFTPSKYCASSKMVVLHLKETLNKEKFIQFYKICLLAMGMKGAKVKWGKFYLVYSTSIHLWNHFDSWGS